MNMRHHPTKADMDGAPQYSGSVSSNSPGIGFARYRKVSGLFFAWRPGAQSDILRFVFDEIGRMSMESLPRTPYCVSELGDRLALFRAVFRMDDPVKKTQMVAPPSLPVFAAVRIDVDDRFSEFRHGLHCVDQVIRREHKCAQRFHFSRAQPG